MLLSPGATLTFRCGNYPIPEVECGYANDSSSSFGYSGNFSGGDENFGNEFGDGIGIEVSSEFDNSFGSDFGTDFVHKFGDEFWHDFVREPGFKFDKNQFGDNEFDINKFGNKLEKKIGNTNDGVAVAGRSVSEGGGSSSEFFSNADTKVELKQGEKERGGDADAIQATRDKRRARGGWGEMGRGKKGTAAEVTKEIYHADDAAMGKKKFKLKRAGIAEKADHDGTTVGGTRSMTRRAGVIRSPPGLESFPFSQEEAEREPPHQSQGGVWVLHNYLARRGLAYQSLPGLSVWLANSTLSLLAPDLSLSISMSMPLAMVVEKFDVGPAGQELLLYDDELMVLFEAQYSVEEQQHQVAAASGGGFDHSWDVVGVGGDSSGIGGGGETYVGNNGGASLRFNRVFDGKTGLPMPHAEGNCSSLAAAVSVLLLLGDGPDGGNDFPPITHATL